MWTQVPCGSSSWISIEPIFSPLASVLGLPRLILNMVSLSLGPSLPYQHYHLGKLLLPDQRHPKSKCTVLSIIDSCQLWPWTNTVLLISVNILKLPATPCSCHRYNNIKVIHCPALPAPSSSAAPGTIILLMTAWIWLLWIPLLNRLCRMCCFMFGLFYLTQCSPGSVTL